MNPNLCIIGGCIIGGCIIGGCIIGGCIIGGCNGAGKTTIARELLPRMGLMRFLNAARSYPLGF